MPSSKQILIVDDSPLQAIVLRRILVQAGLQVATAKNGAEALENLKRIECGLIISDVNMPQMDGLELCKRVKQDEKLKKIPLILCTTLSNPEDLIHGIEVGADNYVTKPYNSEQLLRIVYDLLKNPPLRDVKRETEAEEIDILGQHFSISVTRQHILNFLITTYQNILQQNRELVQLREEIQKAYRQVQAAQKEQEQLLFNIFPEAVAQELIAYGSVTPLRFDEATVMFIDFVGFSKIAKNLSPANLVEALSYHFEKFDEILDRHNLERIKTMGDGYMGVGGVPVPNATHAKDCVEAALEIQKCVTDLSSTIKEKYGVEWQVRIGIHSGPVVAGVVGKKRFAYDIWGDTVNLASRMESHGAPGHINISQSTYEKVAKYFEIEARGSMPIQNKSGVERMEEMYFIKREK